MDSYTGWQQVGSLRKEYRIAGESVNWFVFESKNMRHIVFAHETSTLKGTEIIKLFMSCNCCTLTYLTNHSCLQTQG
jgi:hypothetical protein